MTEEQGEGTGTGTGTGTGKRARIGMGVAAVLAIGYLVLGPLAPKVNTVRFQLGDQASLVTGLDVRYRDGDEEVRATELRFAPGSAPRVVSQEVRLPPKDYTVEIGIVTQTGKNTVEKRVRLDGSTTTVDLPGRSSRDTP